MHNSWYPNSVTQWLTITSGIVTVIGVPLTFLLGLNAVDPPAYAWVMAIFMSAFCFVIFAALVVEEFRWRRKVRYGEAQDQLHLAYHQLRDAHYALSRDQDETIIIGMLQQAVAHFSTAMSVIAGVSCRCCVKEIIYENEDRPASIYNAAVRTIARSSLADTSRDQRKRGEYDRISDNSDFRVLFDDTGATCYAQGDITKVQGYQNSHADQGVKSLPYRSVCVWPVKKRLLGSDGLDDDLLGFLCVDSKATNAFRERYDEALGAAFADTLYPLLRRMQNGMMQQRKADMM